MDDMITKKSRKRGFFRHFLWVTLNLIHGDNGEPPRVCVVYTLNETVSLPLEK